MNEGLNILICGMASTKELPTLAGVKVRTRKRDEKAKYDSTAFCEQIIEGINKTDGNSDEIVKFLDQGGSTLDYRRYAEPLFDILIAGTLLAPGGKREDKVIRTEFCVFSCEPMMESIRAHVQILVKLLRRYKYLQKSLEEEMLKILKFLKAFTDQERRSLAMYVALCLSENHIPASVISSLFSEALVKEGTSLEFATLLFQAWLTERDIAAVGSALRKGQLEGKLIELMPPSKQSIEHFEEHFNGAGLEPIVKFHKSQENLAIKKKLGDEIDEMLEAEASHEEIIEKCQQYTAEGGGLTDVDITVILWRSIMNAVEWNKKEELLAEQALKHLKQHYELFVPFTQRGTPQLTLLIKMQEFCYENMNFMKVFHKIVLHFYKCDILSEDAILKWYNEAHSDKGKNVFQSQMKKMVDWLQTAEEESDSELQPQEQNV